RRLWEDAPAAPCRPLLGLARHRSPSPCGAPTERERGKRGGDGLSARLTRSPMWCTASGLMYDKRAARERLAPKPDKSRVGHVAVGHLDTSRAFAAAGVAVRDDLHGVPQARGLTKLAELLGGGGTRLIGSRDRHVRFLGEMRHTIAQASSKDSGTIPRRRSTEAT